MAITYSVTECETNIAALEAKRLELATLPTSGTLGKDQVNLDGAYERVEKELAVWERRLEMALNGGRARRARRVV